MFKNVNAIEILKENEKIDFTKPVIGYLPDWRFKINPETKAKEYEYFVNLVNIYRGYLKQVGAELYVIGAEGTYDQF